MVIRKGKGMRVCVLDMVVVPMVTVPCQLPSSAYKYVGLDVVILCCAICKSFCGQLSFVLRERMCQFDLGGGKKR